MLHSSDYPVENAESRHHGRVLIMRVIVRSSGSGPGQRRRADALTTGDYSVDWLAEGRGDVDLRLDTWTTLQIVLGRSSGLSPVFRPMVMLVPLATVVSS